MDRREPKIHLERLVRVRCASHIVDLSGTETDEAAIYTLSDPRDLHAVRYVGRTSCPRRRFLQHVTAAKLWLPDDLPWWIKRPDMRALYQWIRELYLDERRLPFMVVTAWARNADALARERDLICEHLRRRASLLNRESETFKSRPLLI
jgi:hypothetical protein